MGLFGFLGRTSGYKKDGRGVWEDTGTHNIRHSTDLLPNGSINEHVVVTEKATGRTETRSQTYTAYTCPGCGKTHYR